MESSVPKGFRQFKVGKIVEESNLVKSFYLIPADGKPLDTFLPGQFLTFRIDLPDKTKPVLRTYSLSSGPEQNNAYRVSIKREVSEDSNGNIPDGLISNWFHDHISVGAQLLIRSPRGKFYRDPDSDRPAALISAGIGITPMLSMLHSISRCENPPETFFVHGARNSECHSMKTEVLKLTSGHENITNLFFYSRPLASDKVGNDYHFNGRMNCDRLKSILPNNDFDFFLCGPGNFIESLYSCLLLWGVPDENIHFESFGPASAFRRKEVLDKVLREESETVEKSNFDISFVKSGKSVSWDDTFESILEFAEAQGLEPDFGCREGMCHTCECGLLKGKVKYTDAEVDPGLESTVLICSSIPVTDLEIDL